MIEDHLSALIAQFSGQEETQSRVCIWLLGGLRCNRPEAADGLRFLAWLKGQRLRDLRRFQAEVHGRLPGRAEDVANWAIAEGIAKSREGFFAALALCGEVLGGALLHRGETLLTFEQNLCTQRLIQALTRDPSAYATGTLLQLHRKTRIPRALIRRLLTPPDFRWVTPLLVQLEGPATARLRRQLQAIASVCDDLPCAAFHRALGRNLGPDVLPPSRQALPSLCRAAGIPFKGGRVMRLHGVDRASLLGPQDNAIVELFEEDGGMIHIAKLNGWAADNGKDPRFPSSWLEDSPLVEKVPGRRGMYALLGHITPAAFAAQPEYAKSKRRTRAVDGWQDGKLRFVCDISYQFVKGVFHIPRRIQPHVQGATYALVVNGRKCGHTEISEQQTYLRGISRGRLGLQGSVPTEITFTIDVCHRQIELAF